MIPIFLCVFSDALITNDKKNAYNVIDTPNNEVFDTIDSLQNDIPNELYVKYPPANKINNPNNQIILLFFKCISDANNAVPKNITDAITKKSPMFLCDCPAAKRSFSVLTPSHNAMLVNISSMAFSLPKLCGL